MGFDFQETSAIIAHLIMENERMRSGLNAINDLLNWKPTKRELPQLYPTRQLASTSTTTDSKLFSNSETIKYHETEATINYTCSCDLDLIEDDSSEAVVTKDHLLICNSSCSDLLPTTKTVDTSKNNNALINKTVKATLRETQSVPNHYNCTANLNKTDHTRYQILKDECKFGDSQEEIYYLLTSLQDKDRYILDQNELISMLIQKLIIIYDALKSFEARLNEKTSCDSVCDATQNLVAELEQENRELKATIKQAYWELEQLENKTEVFLDGSEHSIDCNCKPEETKLNVCPAKEIYNKMEMKDLRARIGVESKNKCPTSNLEGVINILSVSVSQMMMRHSSSKSSNKRIQDLEEQLQQTLRNKDFDIEEERNRRNIEINNLISTIQEQEESLQNLQNQSKNLQDAVNFYLNSITILQESEDKHKAQVSQQKVTIGNLQEALVRAKVHLDELQLQRCSTPEIEILQSIISKLQLQFSAIDDYCNQYSDECLRLTNIIILLRDENLSLAVEYFRIFQEIPIISMHLQKYQQSSAAGMNINTLESTIKDMKEEQNQLYHVIDSQKSELQDCMLELNNLQTVLSEQCICEADVSGVEQRLTDTLKANELLVTENSILKTKVCCDCKTSHVYQDRIDELQRVVADKNVELNRWHSIANDFQQKLEAATQKQASLEHSVNAMQRNMAKNDIVCVLQNEETDACREEVDCCLGELRELKGKLNLDASVYSQKAEEAQSLKSRCLLQTGTIDVLRRDLKDERIRHRDEVLNLKQQIRELKDHDTQLDFDNRKHIERIQHLEQSVHEHSERTLHLTAEAKLRESELAEKVSNTQSEEIRLVAEVTQLEERAALLDSEVQRLRVELDKVTQVCADRQTEMASLKTEVNLLLQRQAKLKAENTKLRNQINCLQRTKHGNTGNTEKLMSQLDNCLRQLEQLHVEKDFLAVQCDQMTSELLQLQQVMQMKDAELLHLQTQLDDTRANRDEVCAESRTVVSNVRQWLHHQTAISEQVKGKIRRLERDNRELQQTINEMSGGACCSCRMRAGSPVRSESCIISQSFPHQHSNVWSLNSNGGTQSPTSVGSSADDSSVNYSSGSENEVEMKLDVMSPPEVWLHKVENMTAEIQRSNLYWKSKLYKTDTVTDDN